jgi:hypothetical protein
MEPLLAELACCTDAAAYLATQDRAVATARDRYGELVAAAFKAPDSEHRWEALHLIALLEREDCGAALQKSRETDPDQAVRACAEALLFRVIVRGPVRASGKMDGAGFAAYLQSAREQTAQLRVARRAEPGAPADRRGMSAFLDA